jgi:hypothetical protein
VTENRLVGSEVHMSQTSMIRGVAAFGFVTVVLVLGMACASGGGQTVGVAVDSAVPEDNEMEWAALPECGDRIEALLGEVTSSAAVTGEFPSRIDSSGDGTFAGTVTITSTGSRIVGVTSPEADVYIVRAGQIVSTPLPKDFIGQSVDLSPGASQTFTAKGTIRSCGAGDSGVGEPLPAGRYDVFAVVVVNRDDRPAVIAAGGPWPLEVT